MPMNSARLSNTQAISMGLQQKTFLRNSILPKLSSENSKAVKNFINKRYNNMTRNASPGRPKLMTDSRSSTIKFTRDPSQERSKVFVRNDSKERGSSIRFPNRDKSPRIKLNRDKSPNVKIIRQKSPRNKLVSKASLKPLKDE